MFPGAGAQVHYNEEGEPLGWDYPGEPPFCGDCGGLHDQGACYEAFDEDEELDPEECIASGRHGEDCDGDGLNWVCVRCGQVVGPIDPTDLDPNPVPGHVIEEVNPSPYL